MKRRGKLTLTPFLPTPSCPLLGFLLTGFTTDAGIVVTAVERPVPNGARMG